MFSIVIIDDSPVIQKRLEDRLKSINGIDTVFCAGNKTDALAVLEERNPDVIILDLQLPDGTGIEILRTIRERQSAITCIVLTNFPYSVLRKRCEDLGADYFFDKSTEFHEAMNILETIVQQKFRSSTIGQEITKQYM
jgi:DNA-binding NarL/FixJ family response regulator